ncbi:MAG: 50S ribosomal protein L15e [Candidatus Aenigmarchaeota archaeon]|nr:50S ribosomal protein L15e [Candidatus Aenigmarchaeota archaeon]
MKSAYRYISESWLSAEKKQRLIEWRGQKSIQRIARPTRPDRAHALGWKAKQGFTVVRVRIGGGSRKRPAPQKGRKPRKKGQFFTPAVSMQRTAEQRAARKHKNMEVLNSYYAGEDGTSKFFEVMLIDRSHPSVIANKNARRIAEQRGRAFRGRTSAGQKGRNERRKR